MIRIIRPALDPGDVLRRFQFYSGCHCTILAEAGAAPLPATCPTHGASPITAEEWTPTRPGTELGLKPCSTCTTHGDRKDAR